MKRRSEKGSHSLHARVCTCVRGYAPYPRVDEHSLHARVCTCVGVRGLQEMQVCKIPLFFLQLGKNISPVRKKYFPS